MCENPTCKLGGCEIPYGLCHCGCGGETNKYPCSNKNTCWIKGEPYLYRHGHNRCKKPTGLIDYIIDEKTGCWVWQRGTDARNYGQLRVNGKVLYTHKYYYEQKYGPVSEGLELDHVCRNTLCVNPDHLEAVPHMENVRRGSRAILNWGKVECIRELKTTFSRKELAELFGVATQTIDYVISYKRWYR